MPEKTNATSASSEAERFCLAAILLCEDSSNAAQVFSALEVDDLALESHRRIYKTLREMYDANLKIDRVLLTERLFVKRELESIGGISYLLDLEAGIPEIINLDVYIDIVKEKARLRRLAAFGATLAESAQGQFSNADELTAGAIQFLTKEASRDSIGPQLLSEYIDEAGPSSLLDPSTEDAGIFTGFDKLDELTGGLHRSQIFIIGARSRVGKTTLLLNTLKFIALGGKHVLFFSLEMPKRAIFERMIVEESGIYQSKFRAGIKDEEGRKRLQETMAKIYDLPITIDDTSGLRASDLGLRLKAVHQRRPVAVCAIDFIQLMRSHVKGNENEQLTAICVELQQIAKSTGIPLLIAAQLNRESEKRYTKGKKDMRPQLSELRGTGTLEQIANVVGLIHRPWLANEDDYTLRDKAELIIAKNRDGDQGIIPLRFVGWRFRFENIE
jgi:replicative DNA helicase